MENRPSYFYRDLSNFNWSQISMTTPKVSEKKTVNEVDKALRELGVEI